MTPQDRLYPRIDIEQVNRPGQYDLCPGCGDYKRKSCNMCRNCFLVILKSPRPNIAQPSDSSISLIPLTQNQVALVDAVDYLWLSQYKWLAVFIKETSTFYAARQSPMVNGKRKLIFMHRQILGLEPDDPREGDHVETRETLNNRRSNLRIANRAEQQRNRKTPNTNTSGYKGVYYSGYGLGWAAAIKVDYTTIYLGTRSTAQEAHEDLYVPAAILYHGDFHRLK